MKSSTPTVSHVIPYSFMPTFEPIRTNPPQNTFKRVAPVQCRPLSMRRHPLNAPSLACPTLKTMASHFQLLTVIAGQRHFLKAILQPQSHKMIQTLHWSHHRLKSMTSQLQLFTVIACHCNLLSPMMSRCRPPLSLTKWPISPAQAMALMNRTCCMSLRFLAH
jgi:hypothetical protein